MPSTMFAGSSDELGGSGSAEVGVLRGVVAMVIPEGVLGVTLVALS